MVVVRRGNMQRRTLVTFIAMVSLGPMVIMRAQQPSAVEPAAVAALDEMGAYLRSLKAYQVNAATSTQEVLTNGQKVTFHSETHVLARMPDRLRVSVQGDKRNRLYVYDGKQFTMLARSANYYATTPAPPTVPQLADALEDKLGVEMPLADLFRWGGPQSQAAAITSAMFVGISGVDGMSCGHYAFRQPGLDWQIWIQQGDHPLPRRLVLTTTTDDARPEYAATLDWNLAPSFNDATFTFIPPDGANRVVFAGTSLVN
jgi:hypothetical protein